MDFKELKKKRNEMAGNFEKMREDQENKFKKDDSIYFPKLDANGNGNCVVRFLPQKDISKHPIQTVRAHKARINNKSLYLLCPSTFGSMKDCDMCQIAGTEWNRQKENGVEFPKVPEYRSTTNIVNVLVVKDKSQPDCVGHVKKMYLADTLVKKINNKLFPPKDEDGSLIRQPEMIHDLWEGKNFNIIISKGKNGFSDYGESGFEAEQTPVAKTETEIEAIFNQLFDLEPDRSRLISNDEMIEKWNTFHSINHGESIDDKSKRVKEEEAVKKEEKKQEKEAMDKVEEKFSNEAIADDSNHEEDESLPW